MANGFANLLAKQKEKANATQAVDAQAHLATEVEAADSDSGMAVPPADEQVSASESVASTAPKNPFARAISSQPKAAEDSPKAAPKLAGLKLATKPSTMATPPKQATTLDSFDDLANLDVSDLDEVRDTTTLPSGFADETPATAPIRDLPDDLSQQQKNFVDMIDGVYEMIHDIDLMGNVIKAIMVEFKNNPEFEPLIRDDDIRLWIRGMRNNMGLAKIRKQEAKSKRAGSGAKKGPKIDQDLLNDLDDLGINF